MNKAEVLSTARFGERVAEDEVNDLAKYFVETDHWRRLISGEVDVIYGPKGAGKSALYTLMLNEEDRLFDRSIIVVPAENPRGATVFADLVVDPPASEQEFTFLWKLYLASVIAGVFDSYGINNAPSRRLKAALIEEGLLAETGLRAKLKGVADYVKRCSRPSSIEGGLAIDQATGLPAGLVGKITFAQPNTEQIKEGYLAVDTLLEAANDAAQQGGLSLWIVIDRLDVAFAETQDLEQNALRALFKVYSDFRAYRDLHLKIFLRSDIWNRITKSGFREASHITRHITIDWDSQTLLNLVVRRLVQNKSILQYYGVNRSEVLQSTASQQEFFYRVFPEQVEIGPNKSYTFEWMLGRTRDGTGKAAPRELIHFLNVLRAVQVRKFETGGGVPDGEALFARVSFKEALPEVSRVRLEQTIFAEYPGLRPSIEALTGEKTEQNVETLARIWKLEEPRARAIAEELVEIGFFEQKGSKEEPSFWVPFLYRDALSLSQGTAW